MISFCDTNFAPTGLSLSGLVVDQSSQPLRAGDGGTRGNPVPGPEAVAAVHQW
jgi:hypothetical protein